ncbi:excalibur calcium-binding domain-containing protein [Cellulomonas sp. SLBN-39]|uniref:excalibur calcium-binding domain-containing protein n=1 Tax=Cellulomonas sp. SLBN-39 TaxID=2768446 RepID=UPI001169B305|nr:excalibur calcium-binding domain-containing protein [Cellulomonas sp. SLBN-39]TQL02056.1 excalibur calcium-binding domain-containing protein [Cellulomonas sp. SLBN-39]
MVLVAESAGRSELAQAQDESVRLAAQLDEKQAEIAALEEALESAEEALLDIDARSAELDDRQAELESAAADLDARAAEIATAEAALVARSAQVDAAAAAASRPNDPPAAGPVYFENCDAARAAGAAPVRAGDPGYASHLDRDDDGVGCE